MMIISIAKPLQFLIIIILFSFITVPMCTAELIDFELITENEYLALYFQETTTEIAVLVKSTADIWYSNPANRQTMETIARGTAKTRLNAQFSIEYFVGNQQFTMDNYNDSVLHGQYDVSLIENGLRVDYQLGKAWNDEDHLPLLISKERFDQYILASFDDHATREFICDQYALFSLEQGYQDPDEISVLGVDLEQLFGEYGVKIEEPTFRASDKRRLIQEYLVAVRDYKDYSSLGAIKTEDIAALFDTPTYMRKWNIMIWDEEDLIELMKISDYSPEMIIEDHLRYNVTPPNRNLRNFAVAIEYELDGPDLIARIPKNGYTYPHQAYDPSSNKNVTYPLTTISLLSYFGAADNQETGYIVVPDGSGAIINFNNGKTNAMPYSGDVYGRDFTKAPLAEYSLNLETQVFLPVFGANYEDKAFLAIIELGDAIAKINAEVAGMRDSYNKVWSSFSTIPNVRVHMQAEGEHIGLRRLAINMFQSKPYMNEMSIRYCFLAADEANYSRMALHYQRYLVDRYQLSRKQETDDIPFLLELIGGIEKFEPIFGVSTKTVKPITTFEQVDIVASKFLKQGIPSLKVRYSGWLKGGLDHVFPITASIESKLGSKEQFSLLNEKLAAAGIDFYPNLSLINVYKSSVFDGFIGFRDTARYLNRKVAVLNRFDTSTYLPLADQTYSLLSPGQLPRVIAGFLSYYNQFNIPFLSLDSLGKQLYADYRINPDKVINRQQAKEIVINQLEKISGELESLMIAGANAFTLPYTDFVVDVPFYSRNYEVIDQGIPFYQIVLRGYIDYAGEPANLAQRPAVYLLKLLETGSTPYYLLSYADTVEVKASQFDHLYSISYLDHKDNLIDLYRTVNEILGPLWHQRIIAHNGLGVNVYQTTYEDGTQIIVNYNSKPVNIVDMTIPACGYLIIKGGE